MIFFLAQQGEKDLNFKNFLLHVPILENVENKNIHFKLLRTSAIPIFWTVLKLLTFYAVCARRYPAEHSLILNSMC